jgi:signal-transduction protein with cAMP-binding, CBS, and nucleotidyltransferase domain
MLSLQAMNIKVIVNSIYPMPESSVEKLESRLTMVSFPKGYHLLEADKLEPDVFFLDKGIACAYIHRGGRKVTFWIGREGSTIMSLRSYVSNQKGYETVELMEDSDLYMLKRSDLYQLFNEDIHIANWGRKFAEMEFLRTEERLIPALYTTASERYQSLLVDDPELLQRIPLETLASYLGITPVSLSRIRAKIK